MMTPRFGSSPLRRVASAGRADVDHAVDGGLPEAIHEVLQGPEEEAPDDSPAFTPRLGDRRVEVVLDVALDFVLAPGAGGLRQQDGARHRPVLKHPHGPRASDRQHACPP